MGWSDAISIYLCRKFIGDDHTIKNQIASFYLSAQLYDSQWRLNNSLQSKQPIFILSHPLFDELIIFAQEF